MSRPLGRSTAPKPAGGGRGGPSGVKGAQRAFMQLGGTREGDRRAGHVGAPSPSRPLRRRPARQVDPAPRARRVQKLGCGRWPAGSVDVGRYCDASFIPLRRPLPGAAKTRLPDAVPLRPAARAARPRRRRQGSGAPRPTPPADGASPPDPAAQAGTRRPRHARRPQPTAAPSPLVLLHRHSADAAALASTNDRRRLDLPASRTRATTAGRTPAAADRALGHREPALGIPAHPRRVAAPRRSGLGNRDPYDAAPPRAWPRAKAHDHHLASVPAPAGRRNRRLRPASPSTPSGCAGCRCCSSSNSTRGGSTWLGRPPTPTAPGSPSRPATCCWHWRSGDDGCASCYGTVM